MECFVGFFWNCDCSLKGSSTFIYIFISVRFYLFALIVEFCQRNTLALFTFDFVKNEKSYNTYKIFCTNSKRTVFEVFEMFHNITLCTASGDKSDCFQDFYFGCCWGVYSILNYYMREIIKKFRKISHATTLIINNICA